MGSTCERSESHVNLRDWPQTLHHTILWLSAYDKRMFDYMTVGNLFVAFLMPTVVQLNLLLDSQNVITQ